MASSAVTPQMRIHGWNIHLLNGPGDFNFAGLYVHEHSSITWRNVLDELRLCFELPDDPGHDTRDSDANQETLAFGFAGLLNEPDDDDDGTASQMGPALVHGSLLDQPAPAPPSNPNALPTEQPIARYHLLWHKHCGLAESSPLHLHLNGKLGTI